MLVGDRRRRRFSEGRAWRSDRASRALALALGATVAACGDDGGASPVDAPPVDPMPRFDDGVMRIDVRSQVFPGGQGSTTISAPLAPTPAPWPYDPPTTAGACRMFRRHAIDNCAPACDQASMCDDGTCRPYPMPRSAGVLSVEGGGGLARVPFDGTYELFLSSALFAPGTELTASAPGDELPRFSVTARMPAPLELVDAEQLRLAPGVALTVRWRPAGDGSRVRLLMGADLGHAQWRTVVVECDLPDDAGAVTVPQAMVDVLADRQNWSCGDCFGHELRRYRRGDITLAGTTLTLWALQSQSIYLVPER